MDPKQIINEAEKLLKPQSGLMSFFSGGSQSYRSEEATDLYIQAANQYRLMKDFDNAGKQFVKAANIQKSLKNHNDVANNLVEAYKCFKDVSPHEAIDSLSQAIHIFLTQNGQFRRAANFTLDLGELYEGINDLPNAIKSYEQAGDYFITDNAEALSNKAFLKCADLSALSGDYNKSVELYDNIIKKSVGNSLSKWNLKDYFLKSILCILCLGDSIEASKKLNYFLSEDPSFESTREYRLINDVLESIQQGNIDMFTDKVYEYDQFSKLDKLKTQLLLKIKNSVVEPEDDDLL
ncbi:alpha-soluble NSF attachment protein [[Candida] jaroonii]|uniref:Alpha-soluble NSF attachment protein n=1 Tax=[Candida] jaroonii TaxID=467808 RepID=A0ACA9Y8C9_9ASCO|nr:alpha-soluble NSF attachment protein [[Candida] jaroonii]